MAEKMALKYGKKYLNKKLGKTSAVENGGGDPYKYISPKTGRKHKKDQKYFEAELHIPREDAIVLAKLMKRAKLIDGFQIGPMRLGVGTLIGFVPAAGDAIDGLLAMSIVKSAGNVTGGLDKKIRARMVSNVVIEVMIGLIPVLGDFADGFWQANTKNVLLLEAVLAQRAVDLAEKAKLDAEDGGHAPIRNHVNTNGHYDHEAHSFRQDTTQAARAPVRNSHVYTDGTYDEDSRSGLPPGYDQRHAGVHQRLQAKESARKAQPSQGGGGGWLNKIQSRGAGSQDAAPTQPPRPTNDGQGNGAMRDGHAVPAQPPRSGHTTRHQVGSF